MAMALMSSGMTESRLLSNACALLTVASAIDARGLTPTSMISSRLSKPYFLGKRLAKTILVMYSIILSSMKMESSIIANKSGIVKDIFVKEGENVEAGYLLLKVE